MTVRPMRKSDKRRVWALMAALWPGESGFDEAHERVLVWQQPDGTLGGFVSYSVRPYANGCRTSPVPFVEGWYVRPELRRQGVGGALIAAVEAWCIQRGYRELGSDTDLWRRVSLKVHTALGFEATDRVQYFRKALPRRRLARARAAAPRAPRRVRPRRGPR